MGCSLAEQEGWKKELNLEKILIFANDSKYWQNIKMFPYQTPLDFSSKHRNCQLTESSFAPSNILSVSLTAGHLQSRTKN